MGNKYWIAVIGVVFALCLALVFIPKNERPAQQAQITNEGKIIRTLNLGEAQEFTVTAGGGFNRITVKDGKIAVTEADCPDQYCVRQGFCNSGAQIVCLPHRLVITFLGETEVDGAVG